MFYISYYLFWRIEELKNHDSNYNSNDLNFTFMKLLWIINFEEILKNLIEIIKKMEKDTLEKIKLIWRKLNSKFKFIFNYSECAYF